MPALHKIHSKIYDYCEKEAFQKYGVSKQYGLICHIEDKQAELENTWQLPIKQRLKLHIQVLRQIEQFGGISNIVAIVMYIALRIHLKKEYLAKYKYLRHLEKIER